MFARGFEKAIQKIVRGYWGKLWCVVGVLGGETRDDWTKSSTYVKIIFHFGIVIISTEVALTVLAPCRRVSHSPQV